MNGVNDLTDEYDSSIAEYDKIVNILQLGRDSRHRRRAIRLAGLKEGDTVLEVCCGGGLSFAAIEKFIGKEGKIIAVDGNKELLEQAKEKAKKNNWNNITFVHSTFANIDIKEQVDFVLFAFCRYDIPQGILRIRQVSQWMDEEEGKICFIDYKLPTNILRNILSPAISIIVKWFGDSVLYKELKEAPRHETGGDLKHGRYTSYYLDCIVAMWGKPVK